MRIATFILSSLLVFSVCNASHAETKSAEVSTHKKYVNAHTHKKAHKMQARSNAGGFVPYHSTAKSYNFAVPGESSYDRSSNGMTYSTTSGITTGTTTP